jgi:hypothetical protein
MEANLCVETRVSADVPRNTVKFTLCITGTVYSYNCAHSLGHKNNDKRRRAAVYDGSVDRNALCACHGCSSESFISETNERGLRASKIC